MRVKSFTSLTEREVLLPCIINSIIPLSVAMKPPVRLFGGVHLLFAEVGGRPLYLPLIVGQELSILCDSGCASDVENIILPSMQHIGFSPSCLTLILNTHCDVDHIGGNYGLKRVARQALICCGDADREQIESSGAIFQHRYDAHRENHNQYYDGNTARWIATELGPEQPVALTLKGGERIRLSSDWEIEILHLPGHSAGHVGALDSKNHVLFAGDAIQGSFIPDISGRPALPPSYMYVDLYLSTIAAIEKLDIEVLSGCHWPVMRGAEIRAFCAASREFVLKAESLILNSVKQRKTGVTLRDLCFEVGPKLGSWPEAAHNELRYAILGHLRELVGRNQIEELLENSPFRYRSR